MMKRMIILKSKPKHDDRENIDELLWFKYKMNNEVFK